MKISLLMSGALLGMGLLGATLVLPASTLAAMTTEVVTVNDMETSSKFEAYLDGTWFFYNDENDTIDPMLGSFVMGPETAPLGNGSIQMSVTGTQRRNIATYRFRGTPLSEITTLKFSTYNPSAGNGGSTQRAGYLQFNVDFLGNDTWQRRLTFVPANNGTIVQDEWQEWDAINGGNAMWTYSGPTWPGTAISGFTPRSWNDILTSYPDVRLRQTDSFMGVRVGEPYANGYTENIDAFVFGTANETVTFDFEPLVSPANKDECKKGGWMSFNNPSFKNQGQCVSWVMTQ